MKINLWMKHPDIIALTTTRDGGYSVGNYLSFNLALNTGDQKELVIKNREALLNLIGINKNQIILPKQTHSTNVQKVTSLDGGKGYDNFEDGIENCDALYTTEASLAIGVLTADCLPIILYSKIDHLIMVIHAGWQGSVNEVTYKTVSKVLIEEKIDPQNLSIYFGPCIQKESLEIKEDVIEKIAAMSFDANVCISKINEKYYLDLPLLNEMQLARCGIKRNQIDKSNIDTFSDPNYFSYRQNNICGRQVTLVMLK